MVRLIFLIVLVLFIIWILRPFLKTKNRNKNKDPLDKILNSDKENFKQPENIYIIMTMVILVALVLWLLPKFGINLTAILQKVVPLIFSLRSILPF